jgi:DNA-binding CsgD family transcriptional regulator
MHIPMLGTSFVFLVSLIFLQSDRINLSNVYRIAISLVAVASVLVALSHSEYLDFSSALEAISIVTVEIATWTLLLYYARRNLVLAIMIFCLGRGAIHAGSALGEITGVYFVGNEVAYMMIAAVALVLAASFFFRDADTLVTIDDSVANTAGAVAAATAAGNDTSAVGGSGNLAVQRAVAIDAKALAVLKNHYRLSNREISIVELWATGYGGAEIEQELLISKSTVKTHIKHIYEKTGVHSKAELILLVNSAVR